MSVGSEVDERKLASEISAGRSRIAFCLRGNSVLLALDRGRDSRLVGWFVRWFLPLGAQDPNSGFDGVFCTRPDCEFLLRGETEWSQLFAILRLLQKPDVRK